MNTPELPGLSCTALLGHSGICTTWKAVQESLLREVNVKLVEPNAAPAETAHFLAISRVLAKLAHPGIAQIHDIVTEGPQPYVVMEHVEGATLAEMVAGTGPLKTLPALKLIEQAMEALDCAWTQGHVVFRNLKPQNLRVNAQGVLKISEFGLAIQIVPDVNPLAIDNGAVVGTPHFISPEQANLDPTLDFHADMYAIGTVLYFLVTAKSPFEGLDHYEILAQQISGQIPHPRTLNEQLPVPLGQFLARLLMKRPADRYATWSDALRDIRRLQANRGLSSQPPADAPSTIGPFTSRTKLRRPRRDDASEAVNGARRSTAPATRSEVRFLLWLLLALWFVWLANSRLDNVLGLPPSLQFTFRLPERHRAPEVAVSPDAEPPAPPDIAGEPARPSTPGPAAPSQDTIRTTDPGPPSAETSGAAPVVARSSVPLAEVAACLATGDAPGAVVQLKALAAAHPHAAGQIEAITRAINSLPDPAALAAKGLLAHRGQEIAIRYRGLERKILPRQIINGKLEAEYLASDGSSRPVEFAIDGLDAAEKLRWLPDPRTPGEHAAVCMLALQAQDVARFRAHRDQTGALAPVFNSVNP